MKPKRLYIQDFMCHANSYIDFDQFNLALIIGKVNNNDSFSNGVGKSTIFKAIEYVLFNQADINLEKIIRDDSSFCKIVFDFISNEQEYRIIRTRTKKGATDLTFLQRNSVEGPDNEIYHNNQIPITDDNLIKKYWNDLSGRRAADTEKELNKIIKTNFNAFRSTQHFVQNDFTGLNTATPAKRKGILKEALSLNIYSKLEKIAKEKANIIAKDIDKHKTLIDNLENQIKDIDDLQKQLIISNNKATEQQLLLDSSKLEFNKYTDQLNGYNNSYSILQNNFASLISKEKSLISDKNKLEISIKDYQNKKSNSSKEAKILINEIKLLKEKQIELSNIDFSQIEILNDKISSIKENITKNNIIIQNNLVKYEELKVPVPDDSVCKHCRQPLTDEHKRICKKQITKDMEDCQCNIKKSKQIISELNAEISKIQQNINILNTSKQQLEKNKNLVLLKDKEISDKKIIYSEYSNLLNKFQQELTEKDTELNSVKDELNNSYIIESEDLKNKINNIKQTIDKVNQQVFSINKELNHLNNTCAVIQHSIEQKKKDTVKQQQLKNNLNNLEEKFETYPSVIQAFSSIGIPNLIIQNVLDDLQIETNNLLAQLKPGLQLSFLIEKTKGDGTQDDTLDINYLFNGKNRDYDQLSGAMKLSVMFSLKLGLSFLLQKMIGTEIKFLLLDEIDQSLDKASVDAFADIVKFFQKDFTILIITHNDRLKDKFNNGILVEQDINGVSKAQVVSSW